MKRVTISTHANLLKAINMLKQLRVMGLDVESTGVEYSDRLFGLVLYTPSISFYFNFNAESENDNTYLDKSLLKELAPIYNNEDMKWYIHNAVFDMAMLAKEGIKLKGRVYCTMTLARLVRNDRHSYSLDALAKAYNFPEKVDEVKKYLAKFRCFTKHAIRGKETQVKKMHYDFVPLELMAKYAHVDGEICYLLGEEQRKTILKRGSVRIGQSETDLSQVVVDLYTTGIKLDVEYCKQEFDKELTELHTLKTAFLGLYMCHYSKSRTDLIDLFKKFALRVPLTDKGNPSFNSTVLESIDHPLPKAILAIRKKEKFIGTYFSTYIASHCKGIIRPFPKQSGTETGRFSYQSPNLQNVPRHSSLRKCFVPRAKHLFVMIDYDQQEYRLLADIACESSLIKQVLLGKDVHTATAELMEVDRVTAKTINFALLYGAGAGKIADTLKVDIGHAKKLISKYFSALPEISKFIQRIPLEVKRKGYIENFMGRRLYVQKEKAYKAVNHLIQSSGADVVKSAMVCLHNYLRDKRSHMVLQVHDEIIFEVHCSEFHIIPVLKEIMESVYKPLHGLSLTCSIGHSYTSWGDKKEGLPDGKKTGDSI